MLFLSIGIFGIFSCYLIIDVCDLKDCRLCDKRNDNWVIVVMRKLEMICFYRIIGDVRVM